MAPTLRPRGDFWSSRDVTRDVGIGFTLLLIAILLGIFYCLLRGRSAGDDVYRLHLFARRGGFADRTSPFEGPRRAWRRRRARDRRANNANGYGSGNGNAGSVHMVPQIVPDAVKLTLSQLEAFPVQKFGDVRAEEGGRNGKEEEEEEGCSICTDEFEDADESATCPDCRAQLALLVLPSTQEGQPEVPSLQPPQPAVTPLRFIPLFHSSISWASTDPGGISCGAPTPPSATVSTDIYSTEDISHELIGFFSWFTPVQIVAVAVRFWARSLTDYPLGLDNWLIVASLIGQLAAYKYILVANIWYCVVIGLPKLSICVLYRRLFPQPAIVSTIWVTAALIIASSAGSIATRLEACRPFATNWGSLDEQRDHCMDRLALYTWSSFPSIITDVMMLALPLFVVWRLQMSLRHKVGLTVTFVVGSSGLVVSITRFLELIEYDAYLDSTFTIGRQFNLTVMEPGIYLLSACLIT
ncbi:hypothetical protein B0T22DRAFT_484881 [Podospora appendiculata]|uniref:Rhodopsin domain-containing protein n=1 Tax=Podospora appendiculata TaxID=314037 RepID=A0AAE1C8J5_9PEZI|nr:hypothetical protein B0T22DRAFT_484881 [Podospora appendiculata]